jgi:hypothetical protein
MSVVLLPGRPATAAPAAGAGLSAECADIITQAAATRADGVAAGETAACVDVDNSAAATAESINASPCSAISWTVTRTSACVVRSFALTVFNLQSRAVIGRIYYSTRDDAVTDPKAATWTHTVTFLPNRTRSWGVITGTQIVGEASCSGQCSTTGGVISPRFFLAPGTISAVGTFQTTIGGVGKGFATTTWRHWFQNVSWTPPLSNSLSTRTANQVRCDNSLGGITSTGCVFPSYVPTLRVDPINATYHRHIQLALQYHMRSRLTRMQDPVLQQRNRATACPESPPAPSYSCDEYPFASTLEGAFTGNHPFGRTFDTCQVTWLRTRSSQDGGLGYSACFIVASDNSNGGVELGQFYNNQRVLNDDQFIVTAG